MLTTTPNAIIIFALASGRPAYTIQDRNAAQRMLVGLSAPYLAELSRPAVHCARRRHLRSAAFGMTRRSTDNHPQPIVAGALLFPALRWNSLPADLHLCRRLPLHDTSLSQQI